MNHEPHKYKYLSSSISLRTTDEAISKNLLTNYGSYKNNSDVNFVYKHDNKILAELTNVLTEKECNEIITNCHNNSSLKFQKMNQNKYDESVRKSDRLLILDNDLSNLLYHRLNEIIKTKIISKHNISCIPLGFGVLNNNKWAITSINNGMRINRYSSNDNDFFAPHKDGQYCNTPHERSLFTLIIYLNDDFDGGETKFYFEKQNKNEIKHQWEIGSACQMYSNSQMKWYNGNIINIINGNEGEWLEVKYCINDTFYKTKQVQRYSNQIRATETCQVFEMHNGITIKEEIESNGGLKHGYKCITIKPNQCNGVIFSQNLIHEACTLLTKEKYKFILKTDIVVSRQNQCIGFAISSKESLDYKRCLNYFIQAQQSELNGNKIKANELYERSLSIRYSYPNKLLLSSQTKIIQKQLCIDIAEIWMIIFSYCYYREIECCSYLFPNELYNTYLKFKLINNNKENYDSINHTRPKFIPEVVGKYGCYVMFAFNELQFYEENVKSCLRVAAIYTFYLMSHFTKSKYFIVEYNSFTQNIMAIPLNKLLTDIFYNRQCHGKYFKMQTNTTNIQIKVDEKEEEESIDSELSASDDEMDEVFDNQQVLDNQADIIDYINDNSLLCETFNNNIDRDYMTIHNGSQFLGGVGLLTDHKFGLEIKRKLDHTKEQLDIGLTDGSDYYGRTAEPKRLLFEIRQYVSSFFYNNDYNTDNPLIDCVYGLHDTHTMDKNGNKLKYFNNIKNHETSMQKTRITSGYNDECKHKFKTQMYNHLIFDFEKNNLEVIENKEIYDDKECELCFQQISSGHLQDLIHQFPNVPYIWPQYLNDASTYEDYMDEMMKEIKYYIVNIKNILNNDGGYDISYNHAGGSCCNICDVHIYGTNGSYSCPDWDDFEYSACTGCSRMKHIHTATIKDVQRNKLLMAVSYNPMNAM